MVNIVDILLVLSESYLMVETIRSVKNAYHAYLDAQGLEPNYPVQPAQPFQPLKNPCDDNQLSPPEGKGSLPGGKFPLGFTSIAKKRQVTYKSGCYKFTPIYTHTPIGGDWDEESWNDPDGENAGGYAMGIGSWNVQQDVSTISAPVYNYSTKGILNIVYFW